MTALPNERLFPPPGGWTLADVEALPEGCGVEVLDGALIVNPRPLPIDQIVVFNLAQALGRQMPKRWRMTIGVDVMLADDPLDYLSPDIVVFESELPTTTRPIPAKSILLVAEVVSKGSRTMDRSSKPMVYAEAGIPHYWRVESPASLVPVVTLHTFALDAATGTYAQTGEHQTSFTARLPEPVEIDVPTLVI